MGKYFGTDGVRGRANAELTPELALAVASAAARVLAAHGGAHRPVAVVGRDPRVSSEMLEAAVVAGLTSAGADVRLVGVLPTPAVAYLTGRFDADLGVMLSASHNPMPDNGVKLFGRGGTKLPDEIEAEIEAEIDAGWSRPRPVGAEIGRVRTEPDGAELYTEHLLSASPTPLTGLRLIVDCAHGAASHVAGELFRRAGAEVTVFAGEPDGENINDGVGSTHLQPLTRLVREQGADLGLALDGDADRCLAVAADGSVVDGDQILAVCATDLRRAGKLHQDTVVVTVMSNLGFHQAMAAAGIQVLTTGVGDRYVLEALLRHGLSLGGEQSGHVIFTDAATTGDGLLTALRLASCVASSGRPLAELAAIVQRLPQALVNVTVSDKATVAGSHAVQVAVAEAEDELGDDGRILLRPSGTEQLVRVMVEARTQEQADRIAERVADVVRTA
ncbi:MAG TPA: phosphoglucosamine mutase [Jatrophihabitans sp.]|nr:phosphoglucosamine mutase [Jatrophihabitans sp.]